jgi:hypothetical protein
MSSSIQARMVGADWPPSVRVRTSSMESPFVKALASARIGATYNQYADSPLRRRRLADYLDRRRRASIVLVGEAAGYNGARVSGIAFTSERQLTGAGPAELSATIVHRTLGRARDR